MGKNSHLRSISLPSRSHPTTLKIEEILKKLRTGELSLSLPLSNPESISNSLSELEFLYNSIDDLLNLKSTQQAISHHQPSLDELLGETVKLLDVCGKANDLVLQIKENVQSLHSVLRRRKGESSMKSSITHYCFLRKKMKRNAHKLISITKQKNERFGSSSIKDHGDQPQFSAVIKVIREAFVINNSIFQSLLLLLAMPMNKPKGSSWLISMISKGEMTTCREKKFVVNDFDSVDSALCHLGENCGFEKMKIACERLQGLEIRMEEIENGLERVFRRLIKTRTCLLNIISQ